MQAHPDFDQWLRQQADAYPPPDFMPEDWAHAQALLQRKRKRRALVWWWWSGGLGVALLVLGGLWLAGGGSPFGPEANQKSVIRHTSPQTERPVKQPHRQPQPHQQPNAVARAQPKSNPPFGAVLPGRGQGQGSGLELSTYPPTGSSSFQDGSTHFATAAQTLVDTLLPIGQSPSGLPLVARPASLPHDSVLARVARQMADSAACAGVQLVSLDTIPLCSDTLVVQAHTYDPVTRRHGPVFVLGVVAAGAIYRATAAQGEKAPWGGGFQAGLRLGVQLTERIGLRLEATYSLREGMQATRTVDQSQYGFGRVVQRYQDRLFRLHSVELPLELRITLAKRHQLMLGIGVALAVAGDYRVKRFNDASLEQVRTASPQNVARVEPFVRLGYGYTLGKHYTVFAAAQHSLLPTFPGTRGWEAYGFSLRLGLQVEFELNRKSSIGKRTSR